VQVALQIIATAKEAFLVTFFLLQEKMTLSLP
jgi:hypothetical protein